MHSRLLRHLSASSSSSSSRRFQLKTYLRSKSAVPGARLASLTMMWFPQPDYPLTRSFTLPHVNIIFYALGVSWIAIVTVLNVAAVGYDTVPVFSTSFNSTLLWYEKFAPLRWLFPPSWNCTPAVIEPGEGSSHSRCIFNCSPLHEQWFRFLPPHRFHGTPAWWLGEWIAI